MAKATKIIKITLVSLLLVGLIGYVVYAMIAMNKYNAEARCAEVQLILVKQHSASNFINEKEVEKMLQDAGMFPKDELMKSIDTKKIEELIRSNDFVDKVECYKTSNNKFCIKIEQRNPVLYVLPKGRPGYFVDGKGNKIAKTSYAANLLVATGDIDDDFACTSLKELAIFIMDDELWNNQVEQIYVSKDKHKNHVLEVVPRVGDHIVYLGTIDKYEKKFEHLRKFYTKALNSVGWNKYKRIDVQYDNQVIGVKN